MYVAAASSLTSLEGGSISQQVSWDYVNQQLIPYIAAYAAVTAGGISAGTYTSSTGILSLTFSVAPFGASIGSTANGVYINIAGITQTGTAVVNGSFPITSTGTSGTVINVQTAAGAGASTLTVTGATLAAGGGALPVKVEELLVGNSMTVSYNSTTNNATWNYTGTVAIIVI
jgi:carbon monoxide dehydrogenase subunit G